MTGRVATAAPARTGHSAALLAAVAVFALAALLTGAFLVGAMSAPTEADAQRAEVTARQDAFRASRAAAEQAAYDEAWQRSFEQGAAAGRRAGTIAGTRAGAATPAP